jgi:hypothetical protein
MQRAETSDNQQAQHRAEATKGLFGWAVVVKKVDVSCELWKKLLCAVSC